MNIIITGENKTGKTTLAKFLSEKFKMPIVKFSNPKPYQDMYKSYIDSLYNAKVPTIFDRHYIDENVYGPVKREKSQLDFRNTKVIEMICLSLNTFNIYCYDDVYKIRQRFKTDNEEFSKDEEIPLILNNYEKEINSSLLTWFRYKIGDNIERVAEEFVMQPDAYDIEMTKNYRIIGNLRNAKYLFVAEKYGRPLIEPLAPFSHNQPGLVLFKALTRLEILKSSLITNAIKLDFTENENREALLKEINLPHIEKVIALGTNSFSILNALRATSDFTKALSSAWHPSFVSRAGISYIDYAEQIKKSL